MYASGKVIYDWNKAYEALMAKVKRVLGSENLQDVFQRINAVVKIC